MGVFSDYLNRKFSFEQLSAERKRQLAAISQVRKRDILVYAADLNKGNAPISIQYADVLPITDQLDNLHGKSLDLVLESPGGSGEVAEDIIRILRGRYDDIAVIIPGWAKSAATIMAMAADEILMGTSSALGPIDAQLSWQGKVFSAEALLEGLKKIKDEVVATGQLNRAYIPILQGISPGELQSAENALKFARVLVTDWLTTYKFKNWTQHASSGVPVTDADRRARAEEIAVRLCDHQRWLTHGRSIKIADLETMKLKIVDFSKDPALDAPIRRYHALLQMTFETNVYKIFETPTSQIFRFIAPQTPAPQPSTPADVATIEVKCNRCATAFKVQANLGKKSPLQEGCIPWSTNDRVKCPGCGADHDLTGPRRQIEAQSGKKVVV